jgi:hypothetical protein
MKSRLRIRGHQWFLGVMSLTSLITLVILTIICWAVPQKSQDISLPGDAMELVKKYFEANLKKARYMEKQCEPTTYSGWENFPLTKCRYTVKDKDGTQKTAVVIMLNPSPEQLARWVVYTCLQIKGSADAQYTDKLSRHILNQSGAQFPVAGIVWEDYLPKDGAYEIYCFRNGVCVGIKDIKHRSTAQPTDEEIEKSLTGEVLWSADRARIQSTMREEYKANGGKVDVGSSSKGQRKLTWLEVSRELYQAAWDKDRNELMIAWAKQNL